MKTGIKVTSAQVAEQNFQNWYVARNAYADAHRKDGCVAVNETTARAEYKALTEQLLAVSNTMHPGHNEAIGVLRKKFEGGSIDHIVDMAHGLRGKLNGIAQNAIKAGMSVENAQATALNAYFGNPGYDQFAGLNQLAEQLYEQLTFAESFITEGDAVQLSPEIAASGGAISRFRIPRVEASGAAKQRLGDLNPYGDDRVYSNNLAQISLFNEFKDAHTEAQGFVIENDQEAALLGYARSIAPALAGFVLQNQLFATIETQVMQAVERIIVDGWGSASFDGETGNYGLLSSNIMLALASAGLASPLLASGSDWESNPTKLIQKITNFNYKPADRTKPLPAVSTTDAANLYADVVRLLNLIALTNVATSKKVVLYMPTSVYAALVQFLASGTLNKTLGMALKEATYGVIGDIEIKTSGLLNARTNSLGAQQYNNIIAVVHGAPTGKKGILLPMATATPRITTGVVSEQRSSFAAQLTFGGPMVIQRGQVFCLEFSVNA
ncbi:MAG TPA: hypothetical protein PKL77_10835 [Candidatus Omnitrophota bacterium]|nr:hypothetical protein [Candidatus Omnitrophota bacterium]